MLRAAALIAFLTGAWMMVNGVYALVAGHYMGTTVGPWASVVATIHIDPNAFWMRIAFIVLGSFGTDAAVLTLVRGRRWRFLLIAFAILTLWYLPFGTLAAILVLVLSAFSREAEM